MEPSRRREPVLDVHPMVALMVGSLVALHVVRQTLLPEVDQWLVTTLGFVPLRYTLDTAAWPGGMASAILSPVTHFLLHGDVLHLGINAAMLLAFGGLLARRMGPLRLVGFTAACAAAGALLFHLANADQPATMIGASGGISGLMAAALRLLFSAAEIAPPGTVGEVVRRMPDRIPVEPLTRALAKPPLRLATVVWVLVNLLVAFGFGTPYAGGAIAWEAHVGGFVGGLVLFGLFDSRPAAPLAPHP